jgi:fermentation-respiration switch protein FrsA (DUF1100 family)
MAILPKVLINRADYQIGGGVALRLRTQGAPVLVIHGENDTVVPISLGEQLYGLARMPKPFVRVAGDGHNGLDTHAVAAAKPDGDDRDLDICFRTPG